MKRNEYIFVSALLAASIAGAVTSPLADASAYVFTTPPHTNLIEGRVMGQGGSYRVLRAEDCYYLAESAAERFVVGGVSIANVVNIPANLLLFTKYLQTVDYAIGLIPLLDSPNAVFGYLTESPKFEPFSSPVELAATNIISSATNSASIVTTDGISPRLKFPSFANMTNRFAFMENFKCAFIQDTFGYGSNRLVCVETETVGGDDHETYTRNIDTDVISIRWNARQYLTWTWARSSTDDSWALDGTKSQTLLVDFSGISMYLNPAPEQDGILFALTSTPTRAESPKAILQARIERFDGEWNSWSWRYSHEDYPIEDERETVSVSCTTNFVYLTADISFTGPKEVNGVSYPQFSLILDGDSVSSALGIADMAKPTMEDASVTTDHEQPADSPSYGLAGEILFQKEHDVWQEAAFSVKHIFLDAKFKTTIGGN